MIGCLKYDIMVYDNTPIYTLGLSQSADVIFYYIIQSEKSCCKQRKNHIKIRRKYIKILTKLIIMPEIYIISNIYDIITIVGNVLMTCAAIYMCI